MNTAVILIAIVPKLLVRESLPLMLDFASFRRQETIFAGLNLFLLTALLLTEGAFPSYFGSPPPVLFVILVAGIVANALDLVWVESKKNLSPEAMVAVTWAMISLNVALAFALASLSYRQDVQYFALMLVPIFQAAFRLSLGATVLTAAASAGLIFFWVWNYFRFHPGPQINEYLEAGTIALIYVIGSLLVRTLVNHLRTKQQQLCQKSGRVRRRQSKTPH